ncbi:MAG: SRPBCC family protein [Bacteroidales bacterium]|nr:SRPBCC family protein [Bacteroidales bacterium]
MYSIKRSQKIPLNLTKAWNFFSKPENLKLITPKDLSFKILFRSDAGEMYPGMIVSYTISPLFHITLKWTTEITQVKENKYFIDNQINGPYKIWHHEHHFKETENGIEMRDILFYEMPLGFIGRFLHKIFIRKKIEEIFSYRANKIKELFG